MAPIRFTPCNQNRLPGELRACLRFYSLYIALHGHYEILPTPIAPAVYSNGFDIAVGVSKNSNRKDQSTRENRQGTDAGT